MKALVWAAGFGTRLLPLTKIIPKPLFPVVNIPMIDIILNYLKSYGITDIGINTHYLREKLLNHLKNIKDINLFITEEEEILGTGGGTVPFKNFLKDEEYFIVHTSDILSNINLKEAITYHIENKNIVTLILVDHKPINHVSILGDGTIVDIANKLGRKEEKGIKNLAGSAISIYSKEIFNYLPDKKEYFEINPILLDIIKTKEGKIKGYIPEKKYYWTDIGTIQSYCDVHRDILINNLYEPNIERKCCNVIDSTAKIDKTVILRGFNSIGKNVEIKGNVTIENCIIWENVRLSGEGSIENSIITGEMTVKL